MKVNVKNGKPNLLNSTANGLTYISDILSYNLSLRNIRLRSG